MHPTLVTRTLAAVTACAVLSLPNVGLAGDKPKAGKIGKVDKVETKAALAQTLRRFDRARGFKKHSLATYQHLKFVDKATSIKGIEFRDPVKLGSNKQILAKYGAQFSKAERACLASLKVQLETVKGRASAYKCGNDRLVLFVPHTPPQVDGAAQTQVIGVDDAILGAIIIIAGLGMWAAFQETEFQNAPLETAILCSSPGTANMPECQAKETSDGSDSPGTNDPNDGGDDNDDSGNDSDNDSDNGSDNGSGGSNGGGN